MTDNEIIDLFFARNENAISEAKSKYGSGLRHIANNVLHNAEDCEECENETYFKAWNTIPPDEPRSYLFAYLAKIVRAVAINRFKSNTAQKRSAEFCELSQEIEMCIPSSLTTENEYDCKKLSETVNAFLLTLPQEKCNIFIRRYWFGDSIRDIAARYGLSEGKVKSVLFHTRNELKIYLEKEDYVI